MTPNTLTPETLRDLRAAVEKMLAATTSEGCTDLMAVLNGNALLRDHALALIDAAEERDELKCWKAQQLAVESEWDAQELAKMLGATLGQSCRKVIAAEVPKLLLERDSLRAQVTTLEKERDEAKAEVASWRTGGNMGQFYEIKKEQWEGIQRELTALRATNADLAQALDRALKNEAYWREQWNKQTAALDEMTLERDVARTEEDDTLAVMRETRNRRQAPRRPRPNEAMSDETPTPRTDAHFSTTNKTARHGWPEQQDIDFARILERELATALRALVEINNGYPNGIARRALATLTTPKGRTVGRWEEKTHRPCATGVDPSFQNP